MSYATAQRDPRRHLAGIVFVVLFHLVLAYALANGLARDVVRVFKAPLEVALIEEVKPPPPPPPEPVKKIAAKPRPAPPPPAYVPPPEVQVAPPTKPAPTKPAPTIAVVQTEPPAPAPPAPPAPAAPPEPVAAAIGVTCPNHVGIRSSVPYPPQALRLGKSGEVVVEFIVDAAGAVGNIRIVRSTDAVFDKAATSAVARLQCVGQGRPVRVSVPFKFALDN